jgi:hypothetical protein
MQHLRGWLPEIPRLSVPELKQGVLKRPPEARIDAAQRRFVLALYIFEKFLGWEWCEKHLLLSKRGFLWLDFDRIEQREATAVRIFELAENIFSLQTVPGLDECLDRLRTANVDSPQVESTYAELEFGRILSLYDVPFRFVPRISDKSADFELEYPDGARILADAKCKVEGSEFSENTVKNSLHDAKKQFPKDGSGIAFIKIPQLWAEDAETRYLMHRSAVRYMAGTRRIASVKFYFEILEFEPKILRRNFAFLEIDNAKSRVQPGRDWTLFEGRKFATDWEGKEPKWFELRVLASEMP